MKMNSDEIMMAFMGTIKDLSSRGYEISNGNLIGALAVMTATATAHETWNFKKVLKKRSKKAHKEATKLL